MAVMGIGHSASSSPGGAHERIGRQTGRRWPGCRPPPGSARERKVGALVSSDADAALKDMSFEAALDELEGIVRKLESGDVPLEQSIAMYERGAALKAHCDAKLRDAQLKVDRIVETEDGPATSPLDET